MSKMFFLSPASCAPEVSRSQVYDGFSVYMMYIITFRCDYPVRISMRGSVCPTVGPSIPCYFRMMNMAVFECKKSPNDIMKDHMMSDDEVDASDVPPRYSFIAF